MTGAPPDRREPRPAGRGAAALAARAPGKVNLCLFVGRTRGDELHPLVSVVQPVSLADELTLEPADPGAGRDEVVCAGVEGPNLAAAALAAFRAATGWDAPPQRLTIRKRVPVAGGMGGGSGDAAAALRLAAHAAGLGDGALLRELAAQLGSDVPAQLEPVRALVTGTGERVRPLPAAEPLHLVVLPSPHALSAGDVYREHDRLGLGRSSEELAELERDTQRRFHNDLQEAAQSLCPSIGDALAAMAAAGADHALVSGSGPTVVGLFRDADRARAAAARLDGVTAEPVGPDFAGVRAP